MREGDLLGVTPRKEYSSLVHPRGTIYSTCLILSIQFPLSTAQTIAQANNPPSTPPRGMVNFPAAPVAEAALLPTLCTAEVATLPAPLVVVTVTGTLAVTEPLAEGVDEAETEEASPETKRMRGRSGPETSTSFPLISASASTHRPNSSNGEGIKTTGGLFGKCRRERKDMLIVKTSLTSVTVECHLV